MPELPEVETTCRGLIAAVQGSRVQAVTLYRQAIRTPIPPDFVARIEGNTILDVRRRAKYIIFDLCSGDRILAHLGMSGSLTVVESSDFKRKKHDHAVFFLEGGRVMAFHDPRRFGVLDIIPAEVAEAEHPLLAHLGPEPLSPAFNEAYFRKALARRSGPIKPALMDQRLVVGVGNIYASESLYLSNINPFLPACDVGVKLPVLIAAIRTTLEAAIASGGSTLRDYVGAGSEAGYFQHHFRVYDRVGEACELCSAPIQFAMQAGRATYWCGACQPLPKKRRKR